MRLLIGCGLVLALCSCKGSQDTVAPERSPHAPSNAPCEASVDGLDLSTLLERPECKRQGDATPIDASQIEVSLSPAPLDVAAGERGQLKVYVTNTTSSEIALDFDLSCDPWKGFTLVAKAGDREHPFVEGVVAEDTGRWQVFTVEEDNCAKLPVRVTLPPSTKVFMPIEFDPTMEWENRNLKLVHEGTFGVGQYELRSAIPVASTEPVSAVGVLRITGGGSSSPPTDAEASSSPPADAGGSSSPD